MTLGRLLSLLLPAAVLSLPRAVSAEVCASDAGCPGLACTQDSDCGGTLICRNKTPQATSPECVHPSQLPCKADSDCGHGFACQGATAIPCSGSTPIDASDVLLPCTPTVLAGACAPASLDCQVDSDCPAPWSCKPSAELPSALQTTAPGACVPPESTALVLSDGGTDKRACCDGPDASNGYATTTHPTPGVLGAEDGGTTTNRGMSAKTTGCSLVDSPPGPANAVLLVAATLCLALRRARRR